MSTLRQLSLSIVAGAGLLCVAAPALAQQQEIVVTGKMKIPEGYEPVKRNVSIKGIDLATPAGVSEMHKRVGNAVEAICETHRAMGKEEKRDSRLCSDFAWASARPQMDRVIRRAHSR